MLHERPSQQPAGKIEDLPSSAIERRKGAMTVLSARLRIHGALLSTEVADVFIEHDLSVVPPTGLLQRYMRETANGVPIGVLRRNGCRVFIDTSKQKDEIDWNFVDERIEELKKMRAERRRNRKEVGFIPDS